MTDQYIDPEILQAKLNLETAQIPWRELQRFFASGTAISVAAELDLMQVASVIAQDNATQLKAWMDRWSCWLTTDGERFRISVQGTPVVLVVAQADPDMSVGRPLIDSVRLSCEYMGMCLW
jgi:hypothetical protein